MSGPFGDGQDCTPSYDYTETHFTDKLRDAESNNDYFGARYFNSTLGRYTSPDPSGISYANPTIPQSLNAYSYVQNNPLSFVDPTGLALQLLCEPGNAETATEVPLAQGNYQVNVTASEPTCQLIDDGSGNYNGFVMQNMTYQSPVSGIMNFMFLSSRALGCQAKIANALNGNLQPNTNVVPLGPTNIPPDQEDPRLGPGGRNGAYNFNYFAPNVLNPAAGSIGGSGRFPGSGLHVPNPGGPDPVIPNYGHGNLMGGDGSYLTAHFDSANPLDNLISLFQHAINDVVRRTAHGC